MLALVVNLAGPMAPRLDSEMNKRVRPPQYADGLLDALLIVAEVTEPMKMSDFNEATWKMLCAINAGIAGKAAQAFDGEAA